MIKIKNEEEEVKCTYFITGEPTSLTIIITSLEDEEHAEEIMEDITLMLEQKSNTAH
tara:strand:- start:3488 stop:3658 length:171 start_codon:yes stop_codon:yes gene_type:complete